MIAAASSVEQYAVDRRTFVDHAGKIWSIREASCERVPGAVGSRCLIFDCATIVRRVWRYPVDWAQLDDDALRALLEAPH